MDQSRCQSCGMPVKSGYYGTETDGSENQEFCQFCYTNGTFTDPDMTLAEMIRKSMRHMTTQMEIPPEQAEKLAHEYIPHLNRWKK